MGRNLVLDDLVLELAELQHGAFGLRQLPASWCSAALASERARRGEWLRLVRGVYAVPGHLDDWTAPAGWCLAHPDAAVGGVGAASWWRMDGTPAGPVQMVAPLRSGTRRAYVHRVRDLQPWEVVVDQPDGCLRVTDATRTLIDCAAIAAPDELERMVESALRRNLTNVPRMRARAQLLRTRGRRGPAQLLAVLDRRPAGGVADSDGEVIFLQCLRQAGLPEPVRQYRIGPTRFDLAWPDRRLLVELDGSVHRTPEQQRRDARKQNAAVLDGWTVLRFTWDRVQHDTAAVVREITLALA
jgi:very-short-patch-repair endonuclease